MSLDVERAIEIGSSSETGDVVCSKVGDCGL